MPSVIKIHLSASEIVPLSIQGCYQDVLGSLQALFKSNRTVLISGTPFSIDMNLRDSLLIVREKKLDTSSLTFDVFVIQVERDKGLTPDELFNSAKMMFQNDFFHEDRESLTAFFYNPETDWNISEQGYPCGSIFTIKSADSDPLSMSVSSYHHEQSSSSRDEDFPEEESSKEEKKQLSSSRKGQILIDTPQVEKLIDQQKFAKTAGFTGQLISLPTASKDEFNPPNDDIPAINVSSPTEKNGIVNVNAVPSVEESSSSAEKNPSHGQESDKEVSKVGSTSGSNLGSSGTATMVIGQLPRRPMSLTTDVPTKERRKSLQMQSSLDQPAVRPRAYSDGRSKIQHRLTVSKPDSKTIQSSPHNEISEPKIDATEELELVNIEEAAMLPKSEQCNPTTSSLTQLGEQPSDVATPILHRSLSGPPTTPVCDLPRLLPSPSSIKPHGIEAETSGKNEFVVGLSGNKKIHDKSQTSLQHQPPSPSNIPVTTISDETEQVREPTPEPSPPKLINIGSQEEEVPAIQANETGGHLGQPVIGLENASSQVKSGIRLENVNQYKPGIGSKNVNQIEPVIITASSVNQVDETGAAGVDKQNIPVITVSTAPNEHPGGAVKNPNEQPEGENLNVSRGSWSEGTTSSSGGSVQEESIDETTLYQVHLLEHACNNKCSMDGCPAGNNPAAFREEVRQMFSLVQSSPSEDVKKYIRIHCFQSCPGKGQCHVPHLAAGCPRPSSPTIHPCPTQSPVHVAPVGVGDCSFDPQPAFDSRTPDENVERNQHQIPSWVGQHHQPCQQAQPSPRCPPRRFQDFQDGGADHRYHQGFPHYPTTGQSMRDHFNQVTRKEEGRGHVLYPDPAQATANAARLRRVIMREQREVKIPDVTTNGFPDFKEYQNMPTGIVIYSRLDQREVLNPGFTLPLPNVEHSNKLGKGGNGDVIRHYVNKREFAVKKTRYRPAELNAWMKLDHPNVVPLLAVVLDTKSPEHWCYQFMPKMTESLSVIMHRVGYLDKLCLQEDPAVLRVIDTNVWHIIKCVLKALDYLDTHNMQHCDIKSGNILLHKTCSCQDVLHCTCPTDNKYEVMLADFDSIKEFPSKRMARNIPYECEPKPLEQRKKLLGTIAYRAPEQFVSPQLHPTSTSSLSAFEGPWCDIFSFGVLLLKLSLGKDSSENQHNASVLLEQPDQQGLTLYNEPLHAHMKLIELLKASDNLKVLAKFADKCLTPDFRKRPTAKELLIIVNTVCASS